MKKVAKFGCLALFVCLAASVWAQDDSDQGASKPAKLEAPTPDSSASASQTPPDYVIGADDILHISVWKESEFTQTLPVRPDGKISLPLLDDVQAAGSTPMQLSDPGKVKEIHCRSAGNHSGDCNEQPQNLCYRRGHAPGRNGPSAQHDDPTGACQRRFYTVR
jgi:hypothetical protein